MGEGETWGADSRTIKLERRLGKAGWLSLPGDLAWGGQQNMKAGFSG